MAVSHDIPPDPTADGLAAYARRLRKGETTVAKTVDAYLARIAALEPKLQAFEHVAADGARKTAAALDALLQSGTDLGPLMGVPITIKDLFAVESMPTTAGSNVDVADLIGPEGAFIKTLKRRGCVILGKVKTVEFAAGTLTTWRGTPWNPCDPAVHRSPGGSSSGSAVAVAGGLCAFSIGSDTGGSVRIPAAFCGIAGLKTSLGLWPLDGVFPLSTSFDTAGLLARNAADTAFAFAAIQDTPCPQAYASNALRLGLPKQHFFDDIAPEVQSAFDRAVATLKAAGASVTAFDFPEAEIATKEFATVSPVEQVGALGRARYQQIRAQLDPLAMARRDTGLTAPADVYAQRLTYAKTLQAAVAARLKAFDAIIAPSVLFTPPALDTLTDPDAHFRTTRRSTANARPGNVLDLCGLSLPIHRTGELPVGLQTMQAAGTEDAALSAAMTIERMLR
ncbi:MAG: amidase [Pseudorhodoplanes sp.]